MATVTRTIISGGGGDYTTIAAWETATNLNSNADIWKGVISDNANYDESVTFDVDGTADTSYVWLTTAASNVHAGVWDTGKARINYTGAATAAIQIEADWVHIDSQQIYRSGASFGNSDEGIRLTSSASNVLVSRCIIWTDETNPDSDGIYIGTSGTYTLAVDNCVIYGWYRGCIHEQMTSTGAGDHLTLNVDHSTLVFGGESGGGSNEEAPLALRQDENSNTHTLYNSIFQEQATGGGTVDIYVDNAANETTTLAGSHNCYDSVDSTQASGTVTNNTTSTTAATAGVLDTDTANAVIITETAIGATFDATPQNLANNVILEAGTDRQGNEPDTRQDFSLDITGATRPTTNVDIGAFQISAAAGGASAPLLPRRNPIRSLIVQ